jgi:hypothetical protein
MKTISQSIGGAQAFFNISFSLTSRFEEYLPDEYKTFPYMLPVIEEQMPAFIQTTKTLKGSDSPGYVPLSIPKLCGIFWGSHHAAFNHPTRSPVLFWVSFVRHGGKLLKHRACPKTH